MRVQYKLFAELWLGATSVLGDVDKGMSQAETEGSRGGLPTSHRDLNLGLDI